MQGRWGQRPAAPVIFRPPHRPPRSPGSSLPLSRTRQTGPRPPCCHPESCLWILNFLQGAKRPHSEGPLVAPGCAPHCQHEAWVHRTCVRGTAGTHSPPRCFLLWSYFYPGDKNTQGSRSSLDKTRGSSLLLLSHMERTEGPRVRPSLLQARPPPAPALDARHRRPCATVGQAAGQLHFLRELEASGPDPVPGFLAQSRDGHFLP